MPQKHFLLFPEFKAKLIYFLSAEWLYLQYSNMNAYPAELQIEYDRLLTIY